MTKRAILILAIAISTLCTASMPSFAANSRPMGKIVKAVEANGGKVYMVPDVSVHPFNFTDFPDSFDVGIPSRFYLGYANYGCH